MNLSTTTKAMLMNRADGRPFWAGLFGHGLATEFRELEAAGYVFQNYADSDGFVQWELTPEGLAEGQRLLDGR